jgi:hypothetical protein
MRSDRHAILLICISGIAGFQLLAQPPPLVVERQGNYLHVAAPRMHFLAGRPLEQLHNGTSVTFELVLTLQADHLSRPAIRLQERFVISFDLWEEKFSIVQTGAAGRSGSHLTAAQAEAWCLETMPVSLPAILAEKSFVLKLLCKVVEDDISSGSEGRSALTLAGLIDVFSRKGHDEPLQWEAESGSLRLADLKERKQDTKPGEKSREPAAHQTYPGISGGDSGTSGCYSVDECSPPGTQPLLRGHR